MDGSTMLLRQIHPSFVHNGRASSQAFRPTPKDSGKLSVYDGGQISAEESWNHYTGDLDLSSVGVMGVTGAECAALDLSYRLTGVPFPEHAEIDFTSLSGGQEKCAKQLKARAEARGWLFKQPA